MNLTVDVCVLSFNKAKLTQKCWASLSKAAATFLAYGNAQLALSVTWVDNGSRSEEHQQIRAAVENLPLPCAIVRTEQNLGFAKGMNLALKTAFTKNATHCLLLSNDIELPMDFFKLLATTDLSKKDAAVYCPTQFNVHDKHLACTHGKLDLKTFDLSHLKSPAPEPIAFPLYYPAASTLWNRPAFEQLGGFNEKYFCYWEDVDLSFRCQQLGIPLVPLPGLPVHHLGRGTTAGKAEYFNHFQNSRLIFRQFLEAKA